MVKRRIPGLRQVRGGWADDSLYPRKRKAPPPKPPTEEERERNRQLMKRLVAQITGEKEPDNG